MPRHNTKKQYRRPLSEPQKKAVEMMFNAEPIGRIADALGVHRSTIWRWNQRADFQREIRRISDIWLRQKRRETIRQMHSSPEYKHKQNRKYYARQKLKRLSAQMEAVQTAAEHQKLWKKYEKTYNEAFFDGKTPAVFLNNSRLSCTGPKHRKEPKYIIQIL